MKKLNQKAFAPVEVLVVVLILIVVAFIGFTAWQRSSNINAGNNIEENKLTNVDAAGFTRVINLGSRGMVYACRTSPANLSPIRWYFAGSRASKARVAIHKNLYNGTNTPPHFYYSTFNRTPRLIRTMYIPRQLQSERKIYYSFEVYTTGTVYPFRQPNMTAAQINRC